MASTRDTSRRIAAIDVGSNSIRLVVAEVEPQGAYRVLDEEREMARLGKGLSATKRLGAGPRKAAMHALARMKAIASGFRAELRAVATSAVREAKNGAAFRSQVQRNLGLRLEVISAEEEALLAYRSAARHFPLEEKSVAVVDIGGGSMEIVFAEGGVVHQVRSLPTGAVKLTEACCSGDPITPKSWKRLRKRIDLAIDQQIGAPPFVPDMIVGSGGTFTALAQMVRAERDDYERSVQGYVVTLAEATRLRDRLREMPLAERRKLPGLNPRRADIILAGVAAIVRLAKRIGTRKIVINERGIRDGILLTMMEAGKGRSDRTAQLLGQDRLSHVRAFARSCRSSERHCEQVSRLALQIFDGLQPIFSLPPEGRELLQAASLLHDVGYLIHHSGHHKHAYHLIVHSRLPCFTARELELIANVARYHRRALPRKAHAHFAQLRAADRRLVRQLSAILRVADGLDRTHGQVVVGIECRRLQGKLYMTLDARRPCLVELLDAERKSDLFVKAFGAELVLRQKRSARRRLHRWSFLARPAASRRRAAARATVRA